MIKFSSTLQTDLPQLSDWIAQDPYHQNVMHPEWWLTGANGFTAGRVEDESGILAYIRLDQEDGFIRFHSQFAPPEQVNKERLRVGIPEFIETLKMWAQKEKAKGLVFESTAPPLISFMSRLGFNPRPGSENVDDYILDFSEIQG